METTAQKPAPTQFLTDLAVPIAIIGIVLMMVLPIPAMLIDMLLAVSLAVAIGVFLIGLFMEQPLEFSAFPAVVLVATLLRLSVNVASTRLILLHGAEGHGAAGQVIETFGRFVVGGNVVVGLVVFLILVVINFVVITKGAGRVAEVAARFALDGMPGKQMAIDADLNAGLMTADEARTRRRNLEREADFFGAMDGASKFVKGDAVAGLLITGINLIGGLMLGMSAGMDIGAAAETFSILSVGDALVSQMPSLLMSTAAGVVVTRSATGEQLGRALRTQILGSRRAVALTAGVMTLMALVPGMPAVPFLGLAGALAYVVRKSKLKADAAQAAAVTEERKAPEETDGVETALPLDVLSLEVGYELIRAVDPSMGGTLVERITGLRKQIAIELGIVIPPVHMRDNLRLEPGQIPLPVARHRDRGGYHAGGQAAGHGSERDSAGDRRGGHERPDLRHAGALDHVARSRARRGPRLHRRRPRHHHRHAPGRGGACQRRPDPGPCRALLAVRCIQQDHTQARRGPGPKLALLRRGVEGHA